MELTENQKANFWAKVNKTADCWLWTAAQTTTGYGLFAVWTAGKTRMYKAHRLAYTLTTGDAAEGMDLDHKCHTPLCVNPAHLRPTTHKQNMENRPTANKGNRSGVRGVHWAGRYQKWEAQVKHNGRSNYLGRFDSIAEAEAAVIAKRNELFTHNDADRMAA